MAFLTKLSGLAGLIVMVASSITMTAWAQTSAAASNYPNKTIRIVVPFTPGGSTDILARAIGIELGKAWGQSVIVENIAGAGGIRCVNHSFLVGELQGQHVPRRCCGSHFGRGVGRQRAGGRVTRVTPLHGVDGVGHRHMHDGQHA